jgi:SRSO17 transposase
MVGQGAKRVPGAVAGGEAGLTALHARVAGRFARPEVRARARRYLDALLGRVERKNGWQLAEAIGESGPQGVQRLLNVATWDAEGVRDALRAYVVEHLGDAPTGVLIVDEKSFVKKGAESCGVGTQYAGAVGRTANAQVGVFLAYASARGTAFLDRALYLPRVWAHHPARRAEAGVPAAVRFATKLTLAKRLLERAFAANVPAQWVAGGAAYGRSHAFRRWLEARGRAYALSVPLTHAVAVEGRRQTAAKWAAALPGDAWRPRSAGTGVQGERVDAWACLPLAEATAPGWRRWLLVRRWEVEEGFAQAKGEVGLDQDEVRTWTAWHGFVTLALLAHAYLAVTRRAASRDEAAVKGGARIPA